jgi:hypothetical protein
MLYFHYNYLNRMIYNVMLMLQVEWYLMRAMSLGLMKGVMDEVAGTIDVTWVQPRVLNQEQLQLLCSQLDTWAERFELAVLFVLRLICLLFIELNRPS